MSRRAKKVLYCFCRRPDDYGPMIGCDRCEEWFHFECVKIVEKPPDDVPYFCPDCRNEGKQCARPSCNEEARDNSKYCSEKCGKEFARIRYMKLFRPKWERLAMRHSEARTDKMTELARLEHERDELLQLIGKLREEREDLDRTIKVIKKEAKQMSDENRPNKNQGESESELDEEEEAISSDQSKAFCVICGIEQPADKAFKHWTTCHRKQESIYNFTSSEPYDHSCATDIKPNLYCQKADKKSNRFCLNLASACPQHPYWGQDSSEICGCPHKVMQKLKPEGNYCLKLKSSCLIHYNWDRFRLASKDMERMQAFQRLESIENKMRQVEKSLNDTYGGVVGVILHNTDDADKKQMEDIEMIEDL